MDSQGN